MRKSFRVFLLLVFWLMTGWKAKIAKASAEFETAYDVRYEVLANGQVKVSQDIALTNKLARVHATRYSLTLEGLRIENVTGYDQVGPLDIDVKRQGVTTIIDLGFNQEVVGTGKTLNFSINYEILGLALHQGQIWEVSVPQLSETQDIDHYSLVLATPKSFGQPTYITPQPISQITKGDFNNFSFTKGQVGKTGIRATFGQLQIFSFVLNYHLENPNLTTGIAEIALPPDTTFQQMIYQKVEPQPINVRTDADGNWLAKYRLGPKEKLTVTAIGEVKIFAQPRKDLPLPTQDNLETNLLPQEYWPINNPLIKAEAARLKTPRAIYDYVVRTLNYDYDRIQEEPERRGALEALRHPDGALCLEFTDLFVTLSRAAGIPARAISGYAYTDNPKLQPLSTIVDILHAWPEYWDAESKTWLPVDPTWGETTRGFNYFSETDLRHFVFAIHGEDSQKPYPAGSYKTIESQEKNVQVVFGQLSNKIEPKLKVLFDFPKTLQSQQRNQGKIFIRNDGPIALYNLTVELETKNSTLQTEKTELFYKTLPPFAKREIALNLRPAGFIRSGTDELRVNIGQQTFIYLFETKAFFWSLLPPVLGLVICVFGVFYVKKKSR